jgi:biotin transport system substrate-specific component
MFNILTKKKISEATNKFLFAFLFSILIAVSAKIKVPFYPVPMTMQTFTILLTGIILGWRYGFLALSFYILEGMLGLPVFAGTPEKGVGIVYIIGPTGGYIFGYLLSVLVAGKMFDKKEYFNKKNNYFINFIKLSVAILPTYILGLIWLGNVIGWNKPILELGLYPFLLGEFFKISILVILIPKILQFKR